MNVLRQIVYCLEPTVSRWSMSIGDRRAHRFTSEALHASNCAGYCGKASPITIDVVAFSAKAGLLKRSARQVVAQNGRMKAAKPDVAFTLTMCPLGTVTESQGRLTLNAIEMK